MTVPRQLAGGNAGASHVHTATTLSCLSYRRHTTAAAVLVRGLAVPPAPFEQVESDVYSCLESMFDEDEARGLGVDPTGGGGGGGGGNIDNNTNDDGDSSNSGKRVAAAAVEQDKGKGRANGRGKDRVGASTPAASGSNKTKVRAAAIRAWYCVGVGLSRTRVASERPMDTVRKMGGEYSIWCFRTPAPFPPPSPPKPFRRQ